MRAPLSWIREFAPIEAEPSAIAEALDRLGLEVEAIETPGREIVGVRVARALEVRKHPNADKLSLVEVDYGDGTTTVVCGAPNVVAGMVVAFAPSGATLPGGYTLEKRKIRGETSDGMLCSARELGLGDDHEGIMSLGEGSALGTDVRDVLGLHDVVFDLSITPNRPDAMSVIGIARELAAHFDVVLNISEPENTTVGSRTDDDISVEIEAIDACPRFAARRIAVTIGASPVWMQQRLALAGMRSISNVVDVTNYVMLERGHPLHAFDLSRLPGRGIIVRLAREKETITTLDGVQRILTPDDLLVCDAQGDGQAIAGIMGGSQAEVQATTTEVLLEAAYFTPMGISKTSKRLGLRSEASARFERGVDPNGVLAASTRAAQLLIEVAAAQVAPGPIDVYPEPVQRERIAVRTARVNAILGLDLSAEWIKESLTPLGIAIEVDATLDDGFIAVAPTYRPDLEREIDIIEEVGRRVGLDEIPRTLPHTTEQGGGLTVRQRERRLVTDVLVGMGCSEAMTIPLIAPDDVAAIGLDPDRTVRASNALRSEEPVLRPSLIPGLLRAAAYNAGLSRVDLALFEVGHVFLPPVGDALLPDERDRLAVLIAGTVRRAPVELDRPVDVHDVTEIIDALSVALELADLRLEAAPAPGFHPTRSAAVLVDGESIGHVGEIAPGVGERVGVARPLVALEVDLDALLDGIRRQRTFVPLSRFPTSSVDLAFVLGDAVSAGAVQATLMATAGELLEHVYPFDEFRPEGRSRSVAFALCFRAADRTLTDSEVAEVRQECIDAVVRVHGAEFRT